MDSFLPMSKQSVLVKSSGSQSKNRNKQEDVRMRWELVEGRREAGGKRIRKVWRSYGDLNIYDI